MTEAHRALDELFVIAVGEGDEAQSVYTRELKGTISAALQRMDEPDTLDKAIILELREDIRRMKECEKSYRGLIDLAETCARSFDCDSDAHRYNTTCRKCDAEKALVAFGKGE